ncbi:MAG: cupin domain-containing protein [Rhodospirillales bacterium]|nr:cupin domain-containing protein [Rhodospirillales bacterium]
MSLRKKTSAGPLTPRCLLAVFIVVALALPSSARAQQAYPTEDLLNTGTTVMGEPLRYPTSGPARVTVSIVTVVPGADTALHHHPAPLVAYILEGELTVEYKDLGRRVYRQGEALLEAMDVPHRGLNLGTRPVRLLAVYLGAEGTANTALDK